jgi:hypothetical protein
LVGRRVRGPLGVRAAGRLRPLAFSGEDSRNQDARSNVVHPTDESDRKGIVSLLWIILIVVLVLVLLGFLGRGRY